MINTYEQFYQNLLDHLEACEKLLLPSLQEIEQCFRISFQALAQLEEKQDLGSLTKEQKIHFFKNVRPTFASYIKYYQRLYYSILFKPEGKNEAKKYWTRELLRLQKFTEENVVFYSYCKTGRTDLDEYYFTGCSESFHPFHDVGPIVPVSADLLLAELLSLERYRAHVEKQLSLLSSGGEAEELHSKSNREDK